MNYTDRTGSGINKRRLQIIENKGSYMDVRIEPIDEGITNKGTPINALLFNTWETRLQEMEVNLNAATKVIEKLLREPDVTEANFTGIPSVSYVNGRLKFSNLKGESGDNFALTEIGGKYIFYIKNDNLCIDYTGNDEPPFKIENGELVIDFEETK